MKKGKRPEIEESEIRLKLMLKRKMEATMTKPKGGSYKKEKKKLYQMDRDKKKVRENDRQPETADYRLWFYNKDFNLTC